MGNGLGFTLWVYTCAHIYVSVCRVDITSCVSNIVDQVKRVR